MSIPLDLQSWEQRDFLSAKELHYKGSLPSPLRRNSLFRAEESKLCESGAINKRWQMDATSPCPLAERVRKLGVGEVGCWVGNLIVLVFSPTPTPCSLPVPENLQNSLSYGSGDACQYQRKLVQGLLSSSRAPLCSACSPWHLLSLTGTAGPLS